MASQERMEEVRDSIEGRLGGIAHLTTALPGMLEVRLIASKAGQQLCQDAASLIFTHLA